MNFGGDPKIGVQTDSIYGQALGGNPYGNFNNNSGGMSGSGTKPPVQRISSSTNAGGSIGNMGGPSFLKEFGSTPDDMNMKRKISQLE